VWSFSPIAAEVKNFVCRGCFQYLQLQLRPLDVESDPHAMGRLYFPWKQCPDRQAVKLTASQAADYAQHDFFQKCIPGLSLVQSTNFVAKDALNIGNFPASFHCIACDRSGNGLVAMSSINGSSPGVRIS